MSGDERRMTLRTVGHAPVRHGPGDWRCRCGVVLSGGPNGTGRRGARDAMRFHRIDLRLPWVLAQIRNDDG